MITQSAKPGTDGVTYRVWAPRHESGAVVVMDERAKPIRSVTMSRDRDGVFTANDPGGRPGDLYTFAFKDAQPLPDMASHFQPSGVHGPSQVIDHSSFVWPSAPSVRPSLAQLVIYEMHVGTFTREGTYRAAEAKLSHMKELGATAIELMPLGDFAGERNWGYDGVSIYAPARCYGTPDDLKHFIAAAHERGFAVILDVVYNHLGPDGNYLESFSEDYFSSGKSMWGKNLNFDGRNSKFVREFFIGNVIHWMEHYHIDGFRLDATHAIVDKSRPHVLTEIAGEVKRRGGFTIAEDERNGAELITPRDSGMGIDAGWSDDFHHVVKVALTGERFAHFRSYQGNQKELLDTVQNGWLFRGQVYPQWKRPRGTECAHLPTERFVYCISNHDQAGNRPLGERLNHLVASDAYAAASALLCSLPYTPMLFMGQEWAASTAFYFFTDHAGDLGENVSKGRLKEFEHYGAEFGADVLARMPDPQDEATFLNSKLDWNDLEKNEHQKVLRVYRAFLDARHNVLTPETRARGNWSVELLEDAILAMRYSAAAGTLLVLCDLKGGHTARLNGSWRKKVSSLDGFGGGASIQDGSIHFARPETIWLEEME